MNIVTTVIKSRHSVRKFKPDPVDDKVIKDAIECAAHPPTAKNVQPWLFGIIKNKDVLEKIAQGQTRALLALAFGVGVIGSAYGVGGGALIAPLCIALFRLPVAIIAGAALAATFATSVMGVAVYTLLPLPDGGHATPDWALGSLFGLGGLAGMYLGAAMQRHVPQRVLQAGLAVLFVALGAHYLWPTG